MARGTFILAELKGITHLSYATGKLVLYQVIHRTMDEMKTTGMINFLTLSDGALGFIFSLVTSFFLDMRLLYF